MSGRARAIRPTASVALARRPYRAPGQGSSVFMRPVGQGRGSTMSCRGDVDRNGPSVAGPSVSWEGRVMVPTNLAELLKLPAGERAEPAIALWEV
jgi:hypothetical protein